MTRLPRLKAKDVMRALRRAGFSVERSRGSHFFLKHADGRTTVVPVHSGETIGPGLLRAILEDANMSPEEFRELL